MFKTAAQLLAVAFIACCATTSSRAETPEEWVALGSRVHGFFGGFIPAGIRIGLDAKERLKAEPRKLSILYYQGEKAPCPCVVDGVMLATGVDAAGPDHRQARIRQNRRYEAHFV
jgi:hypothetical protein